jgi:hypothetical protein
MPQQIPRKAAEVSSADLLALNNAFSSLYGRLRGGLRFWALGCFPAGNPEDQEGEEDEDL